MFFVAVEVLRELGIYDDFLFVSGSVEEVVFAGFESGDEADVGAEAAVVVGDDSGDVAGL